MSSVHIEVRQRMGRLAMCVSPAALQPRLTVGRAQLALPASRSTARAQSRIFPLLQPLMLVLLLPVLTLVPAAAAATQACPADSTKFLVSANGSEPCSAASLASGWCVLATVEEAVSYALSLGSQSSTHLQVHLCPGEHLLQEEIQLDNLSTSLSFIGVESNATLLATGGNRSRIMRVNANPHVTAIDISFHGVNFARGTVHVSANDTEGGGCLSVSGNVSISLESCSFTACTVTYGDGADLTRGGGAVYMSQVSRAKFVDCLFESNQLQSTAITPMLQNYENKVAPFFGSAVHVRAVDQRQRVKFTGCVFRYNTVSINMSLPDTGAGACDSTNSWDCGKDTMTCCWCLYMGEDDTGNSGKTSARNPVFLTAGAVALATEGEVELVNCIFHNNSQMVSCAPELEPRQLRMDITMHEAGHSTYPKLTHAGKVFIYNTSVTGIAVLYGDVLLGRLANQRSLSPLTGISSGTALGPASAASAVTRKISLRSLLMLGEHASFTVYADFLIDNLFIWLGGRVFTSSHFDVRGFGLASSTSLNVNVLELVPDAGAGTLFMGCHDHTILEGLFLADFTILRLSNYGWRLEVRPSFQILSLGFLIIENHHTILNDGQFPRLESYRQSANATLYFRLSEPTTKDCYPGLRSYSRLQSLSLNGTVAPFMSRNTTATLCAFLKCYSGRANKNESLKISFLRSHAKPVLSNSLNNTKFGMKMSFEVERTLSYDGLEPYTLSISISQVHCHLYTSCGCQACITMADTSRECYWYTNASVVSPSTSGRCWNTSVTPAHSHRQGFRVNNTVFTYKSTDTCCPSDCFTGDCLESGKCDCQWYKDEKTFCETLSSQFILLLALGAPGVVLLIALGIATMAYHRRRRNTLARLSKWQARVCHEWVLDAEEVVKASQVIPHSFLIALEDIEVLEQIGEGGFGKVYRGRLHNSNDVAVKKVKDFVVGVSEDLEQFKQEASLMCSLHHPNIVQLMGIALDGNHVLIIMEFMERGSVKDLLVDDDFNFDWKLRVGMATDAARGIAYLHSKNPPLIHRDLKTQNLLVTVKLTVKLGDFGVTKFVHRSRLSRVSRKLDEHDTDFPDSEHLDDDNTMSKSGGSFTASGYSILDQGELTRQLLGSGSSSAAHSTRQPLLVQEVTQQNSAGRRASQRPASDWECHTAWVGTPHWCAPEVLNRSRTQAAYGTSADTYAFGLVLWSLVSKVSPFMEYRFVMELMEAVVAGKRPEIPATCPSSYRLLIEQCWAGNPAKRPDMSTIIRSLEDMNKFYA